MEARREDTESGRPKAPARMEVVAAPPAAAPDDSPRPVRANRRAIALVVVGAVAIGGVGYWLDARRFEETDDAQVDGDISNLAPRERLRAGIGYIPEDRQEDGLVGDFSVADNLVLDVYDRKPFASGIALNLDAIRENAVSRVEEFDVRTSSVTTPAQTLSGGNQQKVIVAREVSRDIKVLLASQPTRGLDVGSIEFVHRRIVEQRDQGVAVVIVSSELDEIYALADRIAVMYEGKITGFRPPTVSVDELGLLMAGAGQDGGDEGAAVEGAAGEGASGEGGAVPEPADGPDPPATGGQA